MKKIPLTQDDIFEFSCPEQLVNEYLQIIKNDSNIVYRPAAHLDTSEIVAVNKSTASSYGYPIPKHEQLLDWIQDCISSVADYRFGEKNQTICDAWITKTLFGQSSLLHIHNLSIFSGLLYLHDNNTYTEFVPADYFYKTYENVFCLPKPKKNIQSIKYFPKLGTLLIFPSYLHHKISINKNRDTRYTLAFNTFFTGKLSTLPTQLLESVVTKNFTGGNNEK